MLRQEVEIINTLGMHARASAKLSQLANRFKCQIWLEHNGKRVNAKSIMGIMTLAANKGSMIFIESSGPDEQPALQALIELVQGRFGEDQ
jgi:phosphocarrier protein